VSEKYRQTNLPVESFGNGRRQSAPGEVTTKCAYHKDEIRPAHNAQAAEGKAVTKPNGGRLSLSEASAIKRTV